MDKLETVKIPECLLKGGYKKIPDKAKDFVLLRSGNIPLGLIEAEESQLPVYVLDMKELPTLPKCCLGYQGRGKAEYLPKE